MADFSSVVAAANELSTDEQETLLEILGHRLAERRRAQLVRDVKEARAEFANGHTTKLPSSGNLLESDIFAR
jgi:hypothetical protein